MCVPAPPGVFLPVLYVPCVSRLPPVSFYRYSSFSGAHARRVSKFTKRPHHPDLSERSLLVSLSSP